MALTREVGAKDWEIRNGATSIRARVGIIASGGGCMMGEATLVGCMPLTEALFEANRSHHQTVSRVGVGR